MDLFDYIKEVNKAKNNDYIIYSGYVLSKEILVDKNKISSALLDSNLIYPIYISGYHPIKTVDNENIDYDYIFAQDSKFYDNPYFLLCTKASSDDSVTVGDIVNVHNNNNLDKTYSQCYFEPITSGNDSSIGKSETYTENANKDTNNVTEANTKVNVKENTADATPIKGKKYIWVDSSSSLEPITYNLTYNGVKSKSNNNTVTMVGDSITYGFPIERLASSSRHVIKVAKSGTQLLKYNSLFLSSIINSSPAIVCIMGGANDGNTSADSMYNAYMKLINNIKNKVDNVSFIIESTLFHNATLFSNNVGYSTTNDDTELKNRMEQIKKKNNRINELNNKMKEFCAKSGYGFLDVNYRYANKYNELMKKFTKDGVHITQYSMWISDLDSMLKLMGK